MHNEQLDTYVNVSTLAKSLGISRSTVYGLVRNGILPAGIKVGRSHRWCVAQVNSWLNHQQKGDIA